MGDVEVRPSFEIGLLIVGIFLSIWWVRHMKLSFSYNSYWAVVNVVSTNETLPSSVTVPMPS
jgi:hypothetical protein